jgi:hypothetical protein
MPGAVSDSGQAIQSDEHFAGRSPDEGNMNDEKPRLSTSKAILTDVHFWLPVGVLLFGFALLAALR